MSIKLKINHIMLKVGIPTLITDIIIENEGSLWRLLAWFIEFMQQQASRAKHHLVTHHKRWKFLPFDVLICLSQFWENTSLIARWFNYGYIQLATYIDYSSAFDTVSHKFLDSALARAGASNKVSHVSCCLLAPEPHHILRWLMQTASAWNQRVFLT